MKPKAIWELTRLDHGFMLALAVLIGAIISNKSFYNQYVKLIFAFLTALFLEASTFSLNDYLDLEIDRKNRRIDRPLVRGDLKPRTALLIFLLLFPMGIISSLLVNFNCFIIAAITGIFAILYDFRIKKIKYIGNFYIAYTTAIPFIFGSVSVSSRIPYAVLVLAMIAFIASLGREMMKDIIDIKGDRIGGVRSIPMYIGERKTCLTISILYISAVLLSLLPFLLLKNTTYYFNYAYLAPILVTDSIFIYLSVKHVTEKRPPLEKFRRTSLLGMVLGLVAFLLGSILRL